jgi:outer membrane lipase/esterase
MARAGGGMFNLYPIFSSDNRLAMCKYIFSSLFQRGALALLLLLTHSHLQAAIVVQDSYSVTTGQAVKITLVNANEPVSITSSTQHGKLVSNGDGSYTYTPDSDYSGQDSFAFAVDIASDAGTDPDSSGFPITGSGTVSLFVISDTSSVSTSPNVNQSIGTTCSSGSFSEFCKDYENLSPENQRLVAESITPLQTAAQLNTSISQSSAQTQNASTRLQALRSSGMTTGLQVNLNGQSFNPVAAGDDGFSNELFDGRLGVYINGQYGEGNRVSTQYEVGSDSDNYGFTAGADYRINNDWVAGAAFGYAESDSVYNRDAGDLMNRAYSGTIYTSYNVTDNLHIDGVFTATGNKYESSRNVLIPDANGNLTRVQAQSNHWGDQQRFSIGAGYSLPIESFTLGLRARTEYGRVNIDSYREKGAEANGSNLNLSVEEQFNDTVITALGFDLSYAYSSSIGVFVPQINLDWEHEFKNDRRDIAVRYVIDPNTMYNITTNSPDRDYLNFRAGISAIFANNLSAFVQYETLLENRYDALHTGRFGIRWDF